MFFISRGQNQRVEKMVLFFYQLGHERDGLASRPDVRHAVDVAVERIVSRVPASKKTERARKNENNSSSSLLLAASQHYCTTSHAATAACVCRVKQAAYAHSK